MAEIPTIYDQAYEKASRALTSQNLNIDDISLLMILVCYMNLYEHYWIPLNQAGKHDGPETNSG